VHQGLQSLSRSIYKEFDMKKKILCLALLGAMGAAQAVMAQDFDDRWYLDGSIGMNFQDSSRHTNNAGSLGLGIGKNLTSEWSVELNTNYQNPNHQTPRERLHWSQYGVSLDALYHFRKEGRNWGPYLRGGLGWQRSENEIDNFPNPVSPLRESNDSFAAVVGAGLEAQYGRWGMRAEVGARWDNGNGNHTSNNSSSYVDLLTQFGVTVALGPEPMKAVEPAPAPPPAPVVTCADKDSDGDGVNDCNDKCPNSPAGQTVGPDGCPVPVTIDLRGVNFDFDKSTLRPDAVAILNEAIEVLKKYPELKVEVAGHTDSIGTDAYNQKLSERRAKAVYDYLTSNGVDAGRLIGPHGYGESRPIAPNTNPDGSDNPEGRAKNRRTELNVQN
jgi:OOP family OmpA-OmpF porin